MNGQNVEYKRKVTHLSNVFLVILSEDVFPFSCDPRWRMREHTMFVYGVQSKEWPTFIERATLHSINKKSFAIQRFTKDLQKLRCVCLSLKK
jgi:hypothetical protein